MAQPTKATAKVRKGRTVSPTTKKTSDPTEVLKRATSPGQVEHLKGVLFGPPKTKKTRNATNTKGKTLLILTEPEGDLAVRDRSNVEVFRPDNWQDLDEVTKALKSGSHEYETAVYDSVTFMFELVGGASISKAFRENTDIRRPYGAAGAAVNQVVYNATTLPMNVIFTAQLKLEDEKDEDGVPLDPEEGEHPMTLAVTPMVYKILVPAVTFIGRTYKRQGFEKSGNKGQAKPVVEYWTSFEDFGRSPAGSRIPIPGQVQDLNLDDLLAEITKGD